MQIKFTAVDGVRMRYLVAGSGEPVVLVHGIGLSCECWLRNVEALAQRHTVLAPDLLGHGFADAVDYGSDASQVVNARHIAALAASLGIESYSVAGSSYGGLVAALMYFEQPQRVRKLVLIGTASTFQSDEDQAKALRAAAANARQAMGNPTLESCRRRVQAIVHDPSIVPDEMLWPQLTSYALPDRLAAYEATIEACVATMRDRSTRAAWRLEQIDVPTWVITGREDIRADWRQHAAGVERMKKARLTVYDKCGHLPFLEHASRFNAELLAFLAEAASP
jgi:2-hydroxy-6-oxonona-2,4-dienedioate hydrolase